MLVEGAHIEQDDLVINPIGLTLVHGLHYLIVALLLSLVVVLEQVDQIALLEESRHPIFLG